MRGGERERPPREALSGLDTSAGPVPLGLIIFFQPAVAGGLVKVHLLVVHVTSFFFIVTDSIFASFPILLLYSSCSSALIFVVRRSARRWATFSARCPARRLPPPRRLLKLVVHLE